MQATRRGPRRLPDRQRTLQLRPYNVAMETTTANTRLRQFGFGAALLALLVLSWAPQVDTFAENTVDAALTRALAAFAIARGINGAISVAQSTEIAVQPAGIGVSLSPGEILDPVNDLVEQFSSLMLAASASLGLQKLLIGVSAWLPLKILLTVAVIAWFLVGIRGSPRARGIARSAALGLLVLRLAVPVSAVASEAAYRMLLADDYAQSSAALADTAQLLAEQSKALRPPMPPEATLLDRARALIDDARETFDLGARLEQLQATATEATRQIITLIAVFVVQTVLLPLGLMWLVWHGVVRRILAAAARAN